MTITWTLTMTDEEKEMVQEQAKKYDMSMSEAEVLFAHDMIKKQYFEIVKKYADKMFGGA